MSYLDTRPRLLKSAETIQLANLEQIKQLKNPEYRERKEEEWKRRQEFEQQQRDENKDPLGGGGETGDGHETRNRRQPIPNYLQRNRAVPDFVPLRRSADDPEPIAPATSGDGVTEGGTPDVKDGAGNEMETENDFKQQRARMRYNVPATHVINAL